MKRTPQEHKALLREAPNEHYQIWVRWTNTGEWEHLKSFMSAWGAREYAATGLSLTGGRIGRVEMRERGQTTGEALFDLSWHR